MKRFLEEQIDYLKLTGYYEEYLYNIQFYNFLSPMSHDYKNCLLNKFNWFYTKQGFHFWRRVCSNLKHYIYFNACIYSDSSLLENYGSFPDIK